MKENIETKDVQRTEYLDKNGLDMLWAKVKENTRNQVEVERNRATTQENIIIETKADKSELHSSYVSNSTFTALQEKVAANTDAISDKQDAGNYLSYKTLNNEGYYEIPDIRIPGSGGSTKTDIDSQSISVNCDYPASHTTITCDGISNTDNNANHVYATDGSIADLTQYAKKSEISAGGNVDDVQVNGVSVVENKIANIKPATKESLGVVKVGDGLNVADGTISVDKSSILIDLLSYGVEWDTTVADPACARIGNMSYHKSLPIQSEYKGCLVKNGKVNYYLDPNDWSKKADGTPSVLDGTDGDVMVHIPKFYGKSGSNGNKRWVRIATTSIDSSWVEIPEMFVSAYRITTYTDADKTKVASVVNTTANYRGGDNDADYDQYLASDKFRTNLGKPRTNVSRATMRTNASNSGQELLCYEFYKWVLYWAYIIEYANFNAQLPFNSELTPDGYHHGGLGPVIDIGYNALLDYNKTNPITPCGYTNEFGNFSGSKKIFIPKNDATTDITCYVNRWRGFENLFGDINTNLDGVILDQYNVYTTSDSSKFGDDVSIMNIATVGGKNQGAVKEFNLRETGEIVPQVALINYNAQVYKYKCAIYDGQEHSFKGAQTFIVGLSASDNGKFANPASIIAYEVGYNKQSIGFRSVVRA